MKIKVKIVPEMDDIVVEIQSHTLTKEVKDIERYLSLYDLSLQGKKNDRIYTLSPQDVYYFDAIDHDVFAYTKDDMFEVNYKLYQLEEMYHTLFLRVNKNTLVNLKMIQSFKASLNGRMEAELKNKDRIMISRMYVPKLKQLLKGENK
ncbi:MAG: LytTR family DNA-binding domain-containing protein [Acholeplasmataceae bacterium]|jgi:DNA-binding LytR/AlgR family response regulator|nr:LytTR family DNA-binding domain-containing protein [Acholeplasmataceae bacterium]